MQSENQRRASRAVENWMAAKAITNAELIRSTRADKDTIGRFLAGDQWPRRTTLARIETALGWSVGTITDIAEGLIPPPVAENVTPVGDAWTELLTRRPPGVSEEQFDRIRAQAVEYIQWQIERVTRQR